MRVTKFDFEITKFDFGITNFDFEITKFDGMKSYNLGREGVKMEIKNGEYVERYQNGQLKLRENYVNGQLHGIRYIWWISSDFDPLLNNKCQLEIKENYVNGKRHGSREYWYKNGKLETKEYYLDGKRCGLRERWHLYDDILEKTKYIDGDAVDDEDYQTYQTDVLLSLNQIIKIKDLVEIASSFL